MADEKRDNRFSVADELRALGDVRSALEAVEREQNCVLEDRRWLRARLEGLLEALREDALVLCFDVDGELVDASGPVEEQLGISAADLVSSFAEFADEETVDALGEANRAVLDEGSSGASVSDGFLRAADEDVAVTWIHVRRWDGGGELRGTEVIGLVAPLADVDEGAGATGDSSGDADEDLLGHLARRLLDDVGEASITRAVQMFGDFLSADRVVVNRYDDDARKFFVMSSWLRGETKPLAAEVRGISISELPWAYSALGAGEALVISAAADLPADAVAEKALYAGDDAKASLLVPMVLNDRLTGFISIQATGQEREWGASDILRAQQFAMALSAAMARAEVGKELAGARSNLTEVEAKLEDARTSESEARQAADEARSDLEGARQEAEEARAEAGVLKQEAEDVRTELENLKEDGERAQRLSEDTAADALGLRTELEELRVRVEEARSEAAEARAELRQLRDAGGYDPDGTVEMSSAGVERKTFDPDATVEIEALPAEPEEPAESEEPGEPEEPGEDEVVAEVPEVPTEQEPEPEIEEEGEEEGEAAEIGDPEVTVEVELPSLSADPDNEELPRAVGLGDRLERTQAGAIRESGPATWKSDKAGWEDSTDEVALPEFLDTDDEEAEGSREADAEVSGDVEAARRLARQIAGKDEGDVDRADAAEPAAQVPDLVGIDADVGLQDVGGNVELYRNLLAKFRNDYIGAAAKIDSAIEKGNIEVAHLLLHAVKGVAGILGATGVRDAADALETQLIGNDPTATKTAVEGFTATLNGLLESIATLDNEAVAPAPSMPEPTAPSPEAHVSDPLVLRSYLSGLRQHLLAEKPRQCQLVMREITARTWPGDYNERVARLAGLIDEGRFEEARATFEELMDQFVSN